MIYQLLFLLSLSFSKINSNYVIWKSNERYGIETAKGCAFEQQNDIIVSYSDDVERNCGKTCYQKFKNCTHFFWLNSVCLIKSGYVNKKNVIKNYDTERSECGIISSRIFLTSSLSTASVKSDFVLWELNEKYRIETTKGCSFEQQNEVIVSYPNDTEGTCGRTCFFKFKNCTHYFWFNCVCLIKSGYISKNNVKKANYIERSECGIISSRISSTSTTNTFTTTTSRITFASFEGTSTPITTNTFQAITTSSTIITFTINSTILSSLISQSFFSSKISVLNATNFSIKQDSSSKIVMIGGIATFLLILFALGIIIFLKKPNMSISNSNLYNKYEMNAIENSTYKRNSLNLRIFSENKLVFNKTIGSGTFGQVFQGYLKKNNKLNLVAIKKLQLEQIADNNELLQEAILLNRCNHANLIKLYGVCMEKNSIKYMVIEYMNLGNLLSYLKGKHECLPIKEIIQISIEIAKGCAYLEQSNIVHRDLAARNCLLSQGAEDTRLTLKIGDFGLARNMYSKNYYQLQNLNAMLPIKWMAPESIKEQKFTTKSDVWSYAILVCEIFNKGATPYLGLSNLLVIENLQNGKIHEIPSNCPEEIKHLLNKSWSFEEDQRPTFESLLASLNEYLAMIY